MDIRKREKCDGCSGEEIVRSLEHSHAYEMLLLIFLLLCVRTCLFYSAIKRQAFIMDVLVIQNERRLPSFFRRYFHSTFSIKCLFCIISFFIPGKVGFSSIHNRIYKPERILSTTITFSPQEETNPTKWNQ